MDYSLLKYLKRLPALLVVIAFVTACASSQETAKQPSSSSQAEDKSQYKSYDEVITDDAQTEDGLFTIHKVEEKYYYEIPDSLLEQEMLLVSRIAGTQNDLSFGGAGMKARSQQVVRWQKKNKKILLRHVSHESVADEHNPIYESVKNNNFEPVVQSFDIETVNKDSASDGAQVIDVTDLFTSDVPLISGLNKAQRKEFEVSRLDGDRSFIDSIRTYPKNIEARHILTYNSNNPPDDASTGTISLEMNQSMILLPDEQMAKRVVDKRVGYFSIDQTQYGGERHKADEKQFITRYKLVPKDKEAYLDGELVEPVEPIVYYIDPATPEKWRSYIKQGVEDWQEAFETAGFKNAIIAKDPPTEEEDSTFSPEDVRYSVIRYIANDIPNAQGPHVHDPRTGQILESDILWYHNVMNLLRNWYFVQTAAVNPKARSVQFEDEVMGELVRFVSSHEIGHTLGLPHNMGSSFAYPVDSLRSPSFTSTHGTAPSIMDYARFNYVAQPEDGVTNFYPAIGEYDKWAIKWGYTWFPEDMSKNEIEQTLDEWTKDRADDPRYFYGSGGNDPRVQTEDLSNNAMRASELGMKNLGRITQSLIEWTARDGADYEELEELYGQIVAQWGRYLGHVTNNIGGIYETDKTYDQEGPVYEFVSEQKQRRAMDWLGAYGFEAPEWMFNEDVLDRINESSVVDDIRSAQSSLVSSVASPQLLGRLIEWEARSEEDSYTAFEMMDDLRNSIWSELESGSPEVNVYRRNLQRAYLERMEYLMTEELTIPSGIPAEYRQYFDYSVDVSQSDIRPIVRNQLEELLDDIRQTQNQVGDRTTEAHLSDAEIRIEHILDPDN